MPYRWLLALSFVISGSIIATPLISESVLTTPLPTARFVIGPSLPIWLLGSGIGASAQLGFRTGNSLYLGIETGTYYWLGANSSNLKLNALSFPILASAVYKFVEAENTSPYLGVLVGITKVSGQVQIASLGGKGSSTFFTFGLEPGLEFQMGQKTSFFIEAKAGALIGEGGFWPVFVPTAGLSLYF